MIKLFSGEDSLLILHRFHQSARQKQTKTQFHFIACKTSRNPNTEKKIIKSLSPVVRTGLRNHFLSEFKNKLCKYYKISFLLNSTKKSTL